MAYAIVKFTQEEDSPGIVATNWIFGEDKQCFYSIVGSDAKKQKMLIERAAPEEHWLTCPIAVLKKFASYSAARIKLSDAEYTSNLESEDDIDMPRKKFQKSIKLPVESSSDADIADRQLYRTKTQNQSNKQLFHQPIKGKCVVPLPLPPGDLFDAVEESESLLKSISSPVINHQESPQHKHVNDSFVESNFDWLRTPSLAMPPTRYNNELERLKTNQATMWSVLGALLEISKDNSRKLDIIMNKLESIDHTKGDLESEDLKMLSLLPVGIDDFDLINEKILESPLFKRNLKHALEFIKDLKKM